MRPQCRPSPSGVFLHPNPHVTIATALTAAFTALRLIALIGRALGTALGTHLCRRTRTADAAADPAAANADADTAAADDDTAAADAAANANAAAAPPDAAHTLLHSLRPGGSGSLLMAYVLHWLPYATQERQTFLFYYLPAYYFAILLGARAWHATACAALRPPVALAATVALIAAVGGIATRLAPLAYASPAHLSEWTDALKLASTECWGDERLEDATCWVDAKKG